VCGGMDLGPLPCVGVYGTTIWYVMTWYSMVLAIWNGMAWLGCEYGCGMGIVVSLFLVDIYVWVCVWVGVLVCYGMEW